MENKLPEGWKLVELKDYAYFQEGPGIRKWQFTDKGIKLLNVRNLVNGELNLNNTERYVSEEEAFGKYKHFLLNPDEIVMASSGVTWGKTAIVRSEHLPLMLNTSTIRFRSLDCQILDQSYLLHYLNSELFSKQIERLITGSAQPNFGPSHLMQVELILPPLETQKKIVSILEKAEETKKLRAQADELTQKLLQSVFLEMFGDLVENPKGWDEKSLEDLCSHIIDCPHSTPKYEECITPYPCIRTTELKNGYIEWSEMKYISEEGYKERIKRLIPVEGDVVYGREGTYGEAIRIPKNTNICLGQRVMLFRPNNDLCNSEFLWALVRSDGVYQQALRKTSGSTVGHVNVNDIKKFTCFCPPLSLQDEFSNIVKSVEVLRENRQQSSLEINTLFDALMQKAFTGELVS